VLRHVPRSPDGRFPYVQARDYVLRTERSSWLRGVSLDFIDVVFMVSRRPASRLVLVCRARFLLPTLNLMLGAWPTILGFAGRGEVSSLGVVFPVAM
jgi:hypothetical protein